MYNAALHFAARLNQCGTQVRRIRGEHNNTIRWMTWRAPEQYAVDDVAPHYFSPLVHGR
jgi:hypothetical protein